MLSKTVRNVVTPKFIMFTFYPHGSFKTVKTVLRFFGNPTRNNTSWNKSNIKLVAYCSSIPPPIFLNEYVMPPGL